jgi:hypothetical protein
MPGKWLLVDCKEKNVQCTATETKLGVHKKYQRQREDIMSQLAATYRVNETIHNSAILTGSQVRVVETLAN